MVHLSFQRGLFFGKKGVIKLIELEKIAVNNRITLHNWDVWRLRAEASKKLEEVSEDIKDLLRNASGEKELARVIYPEEPIGSFENLWEAKLSASNGVLKIKKKPLGEKDFPEETLIPSGRLDYLIRELHPQVIIDFAKQVKKK